MKIEGENDSNLSNCVSSASRAAGTRNAESAAAAQRGCGSHGDASRDVKGNVRDLTRVKVGTSKLHPIRNWNCFCDGVVEGVVVL